MKYSTTKCSAEEMRDNRENTENNLTGHYVVSRWERVFWKLCIINWNQNKKVTQESFTREMKIFSPEGQQRKTRK